MGVVWKEIGMRQKPHNALTIIVGLFPRYINNSSMDVRNDVPLYRAFIYAVSTIAS